MAKLYKIQLSEKGKLIGDKEGNAEIRKVEISALATCVQMVAGKEKDIKKYNICQDLHAQLTELTDNDKTEIRDISEDDLSIINDGFKQSAEMQQMQPSGEIIKGRPPVWMYCHALWRQLTNPIEQKTEEEKKKE